MTKTIYIDCTDLIQTDINTGIQRVARNIINNRLSAQNELNTTIQPVYYSNRYGFTKVEGCKKSDLFVSLGYFHNLRSYLNEFWRFRILSKQTFPFTRFCTYLDRYWKGYFKYLFAIPIFCLSAPIIILTLIYTSLIKPRRLWQPEKSDIFVLPGSSWWNTDINNGVTNIKQNNGFIVTIIFDLIPLSHPQYFSDETGNNFKSKLPFILEHTDLFISISKFTEDCLKPLISEQKQSRNASTTYFYLGADLDLIDNTHIVRNTLPKAFSSENTYICVGTIEPRKNHAFLLDVFDYLWSKKVDVNLLIIGINGWKSEKIIDRIREHSLFNKKLLWQDDLTDNELIFSYTNAKALIAPSIIEGFGLPIIEALTCSCPVFASDIPIFREIGGDKCTYFSLDSVNDLASKIIHFEERYELNNIKNIDTFTWSNWEASSLDFYTKIVNHFADD